MKGEPSKYPRLKNPLKKIFLFVRVHSIRYPSSVYSPKIQFESEILQAAAMDLFVDKTLTSFKILDKSFS
ncbi:MAG: hypothetical protein ABI045_04295 [Flavobacteriales bacterium]